MPKSSHEPKIDSKCTPNVPKKGAFLIVFVRIYNENSIFLQKDPKGPQEMPQEPP
jgi:hypothetical protein